MPKAKYINELEEEEQTNKFIHSGVQLPIEAVQIIQAKAIAEILANLTQISASLERIAQQLEQHERTTLEHLPPPSRERAGVRVKKES